MDDMQDTIDLLQVNDDDGVVDYDDDDDWASQNYLEQTTQAPQITSLGNQFDIHLTNLYS